jgi:RimJ/RimL family protein N-acetyltransferase
MTLVVREMQPAEVQVRIDYFHSASPDYLRMMGVDPARLPSPAEWLEQYRRDAALPREQRPTAFLVWLIDDSPIGFSSADAITFGLQANMHLHILDPQLRQQGLGTRCVRESAALYFELLGLQRLFSQPNAFNTAPNRALQRAGFRYLETIMAAPSPINYLQPVTRWVLERNTVAVGA